MKKRARLIAQSTLALNDMFKKNSLQIDPANLKAVDKKATYNTHYFAPLSLLMFLFGTPNIMQTYFGFGPLAYLISSSFLIAFGVVFWLSSLREKNKFIQKRYGTNHGLSFIHRVIITREFSFLSLALGMFILHQASYSPLAKGKNISVYYESKMNFSEITFCMTMLIALVVISYFLGRRSMKKRVLIAYNRRTRDTDSAEAMLRELERW